jgi:hypothetical protein
MLQRTPPSWFIRKLKAIDRRLTAEWKEGLERWVIAERVRWGVFSGIHEGQSLYYVKTRTPRVFYVEELGTHVLEWLRRADMRRFKTIDQMEEELEMNKSDHEW